MQRSARAAVAARAFFVGGLKPAHKKRLKVHVKSYIIGRFDA
jgi:hypothetical protein